ncbi:TPA: hypothetical protein ACHWYP_001757 [Streptococcus pneumoniae]
MTAEIGILNKNGVVLAADSAVTLSDGINSKVFNSARKLFTLSRVHSVGIMIYGDASFMGVPWEVIISEYKKSIGNEVLADTAMYINNFVDFLLQFMLIQSNDALVNYIIRQTRSYLKIIHESTQEIADHRSDQGDVITLEIFKNILWEVIEEYSNDISKSISETEFEYLDGELDLIREQLDEYFNNNEYSDEQLNFLSKTIYKAMLVGFDRNSVTGLVIAGYGVEEIFPSLRQIELSGVFAKRLVWRVITEKEISQNVACHIISFAQSEMVDTIMNGIDPMLNAFIGQQINEILESNNISDAQEELFETIARVQQQYYINPIFELIGMQPIDEMASTAKTFIELTSFKRKIVNTLETVGGPVDVLAISKGEGPIWIERKHYFNIENNIDYKIRKGDI